MSEHPTPVDKSGSHDVPGPVEVSYADAISSIEEIIEDARNGRMYILVDHEDRENEGDLCIPAQMATPDAINFMAKNGRGLICLAMTSERIDQLGLPLMASSNSSRQETAFTVSIEAREGISTGISAADRARTVSVAINAASGPADLASPGHVFPLRARDGGVLVRAGHTEAVVDVSRLAGLMPAGVICEVMGDDGEMSRLPELIAFGQKHGIKIGTISDLIAYRRRHDSLVKETSTETVTSGHGGEWTMRVFTDQMEGQEHLVLTKGEMTHDTILTRVHVLEPKADLLGLVPGREGDLGRAMEAIAAEGRGVVVLLRDTEGTMATEADYHSRTLRQYGLGAQILAALGLSKLELLTNSGLPKVIGIEGYGLEITTTRSY